MRSRLLDVAKGHARVQGSRYEGVPERVGTDRLVYPGTAGHPANDPSGTVAVHSLAVGAHEDGTGEALAYRQVDRPGCARRQGDGHHLPALAQHSQGAVAPLQAEGFDVGAKGLLHPQAVQRQ